MSVSGPAASGGVGPATSVTSVFRRPNSGCWRRSVRCASRRSRNTDAGGCGENDAGVAAGSLRRIRTQFRPSVLAR